MPALWSHVAVSKQQTHALITYFLQGYESKYESAPRDFNRFRDQWGFQSMIEQYGASRAKKIVDYYFATHRPGHPVSYLLYNYERLNAIMADKEKDEAERAKLRAESEKRVKEWRGK